MKPDETSSSGPSPPLRDRPKSFESAQAPLSPSTADELSEAKPSYNPTNPTNPNSDDSSTT
jgi:hypothetical protein